MLSSRKRKAVDEPCINRHSNFFLLETVRQSCLRVYLLSRNSQLTRVGNGNAIVIMAYRERLRSVVKCSSLFRRTLEINHHTKVQQSFLQGFY